MPANRFKAVPQLFEPWRLTNDFYYADIVCEYIIDRDLDVSNKTAAREISAIRDLFARFGIPSGLSDRFVRRAYEDLTDYSRFLTFAEEDIEQNARSAARLEELNAASDSLRGQYARASAAAETKWRTYAADIRVVSETTLRSMTGIEDMEFYEQLYAIPIERGAQQVDMEIADHETILLP